MKVKELARLLDAQDQEAEVVVVVAIDEELAEDYAIGDLDGEMLDVIDERSVYAVDSGTVAIVADLKEA